MARKKSLDENTFKTCSGFWRVDGNLDEICLKHCLKPVPFWMEKKLGWKVGWCTTHQSFLLLVVAVVESDELPDETRSTLDESWMETLDGNRG